MRRIVPEDIDAASVFEECVAQKQNAALRVRLTVAAPVLDDAILKYDEHGPLASLYALEVAEMPSGSATADELVDLYETTYVRQGGRGRPYYDRIKLSAPGGRCPYCGQLPVNVLDHYLPKRPEGILAVLLRNLVPCCRDCNSAKGDRTPRNEETQPIHPYFDDFDDAQWLHATVHNDNGITVEFFVAEVIEWKATKQARALHHFNLFQLGKLFTTEAATELVNIKHRLQRLYEERGGDGVENHLREEADARAAAFINSWQTALYQALADSRAFCDGGFETI